MQDRGYVIIAVNDAEYRMAAGLAYSIMLKNSNASISMLVDNIDAVDNKWLEPFANIIELPFFKAENARENDWQLYWSTPYQYTIAIDCRSIVKENHDQIWDYLIGNYELYFPTQILNFDGDVLQANHMAPYRSEYFMLPVFSNMFYFEKDSEQTLRYFKLADPYMREWRTALAKHFSAQHVPTHYSADIMHSLLMECLIEQSPQINKDILTYIDMLTALTDDRIGRWSNWIDRLNVWSSRGGKIKIQNFAINRTLFYFNEEFLTDEIFNEHRDQYRATFKAITNHY